MSTNTDKKTTAAKRKVYESPRHRFEEIAVNRVKTALLAIDRLGGCANLRTYQFSDGDISAIESALNNELSATMGKFRQALKDAREGKTTARRREKEFTLPS